MRPRARARRAAPASPRPGSPRRRPPAGAHSRPDDGARRARPGSPETSPGMAGDGREPGADRELALDIGQQLLDHLVPEGGGAPSAKKRRSTSAGCTGSGKPRGRASPRRPAPDAPRRVQIRHAAVEHDPQPRQLGLQPLHSGSAAAGSRGSPWAQPCSTPTGVPMKVSQPAAATVVAKPFRSS